VYWDWVKGSLFGIHKVRFAKVELTKDLTGRKRDLNIRPESTRIRFIQWPVLIGFTVHAFPAMFVSSLREFPENCVYRQGGINCFIEYLHRKLLTANFFSYDIKRAKK
jgi:hypothetical protein